MCSGYSLGRYTEYHSRARGVDFSEAAGITNGSPRERGDSRARARRQKNINPLLALARHQRVQRQANGALFAQPNHTQVSSRLA